MTIIHLGLLSCVLLQVHAAQQTRTNLTNQIDTIKMWIHVALGFHTFNRRKHHAKGTHTRASLLLCEVKGSFEIDMFVKRLRKLPIQKKRLLTVGAILLIACAVAYFICVASLQIDAAIVQSIYWPDDLATQTSVESRQVILTSFVFFSLTDTAAMDGVKRFVATLRGSGSQAAVIVFVVNAPPGLRGALSKFRAAIVEYEPGVLATTQLFSSSSVRFWLYNRFMSRYGAFFDFVMISDVSDVVFQKNPFESISTSSAAPLILAALEETDITAEGINGYWVKKCFGAETLERLISQPVSCSGTTIGDRASMAIYIDEMEAVQRRSVFCSVQGVDQGVHNVILRENPMLSARTRFYKNSHGPFLTFDKLRTLRFNHEGLIVNSTGATYPILHQINRCKAFVKEFLEVDSHGQVVGASTFNCERLFHPATELS